MNKLLLPEEKTSISTDFKMINLNLIDNSKTQSPKTQYAITPDIAIASAMYDVKSGDVNFIS